MDAATRFLMDPLVKPEDDEREAKPEDDEREAKPENDERVV